MTRDLSRLAAALGALTGVGFLYLHWLHATNATTVALSFVLIVVITATVSRLWVAVVTSIAAMVAFNFFFLPPVGTLTIADPQNWLALFTFVAVSLVASHLSSMARVRADEALARRDEMAKLFDVSRDVLLITDGTQALPVLARAVARRFGLDYAAICLPRGEAWDITAGGPAGRTLDAAELSRVFAAARALDRPDGLLTPGASAPAAPGGGAPALVPLRLGARTIGLMAISGRLPEAGALDALGGVAAIAIERAHFLDELKDAELARQREELKSALLGSIGHDLRTPLTAIRVAAGNLQASWLTEADRREQSELVLAEVGRLTRLFDNILEMARIDAGAVAASRQWVHPSEIVEAALDQAGSALRRRPLAVAIDGDALVRLDPRLTAAALAQLLENAAQYAPGESTIDVAASVTSEGLQIAVRDRGPGIAPADLPRLFERFYRGAASRGRAAGSGMGLAIARGLLAAEHGGVRAENCADGGAQFTMVVPAERKLADGEQAPA